MQEMFCWDGADTWGVTTLLLTGVQAVCPVSFTMHAAIYAVVQLSAVTRIYLSRISDRHA